MEPGQRFILWCLFINTAFPETGKKYVFVGNLFPFPGMEKEWHLDLSYSAVLGIHIFPRYIFLNLMTIWLLRSSSSSQFLFPTESILNKTAVLFCASALFLFWSQETTALVYLSRKYRKLQKSKKKIIRSSFCSMGANLLSVRKGFEVVGGRFR